MLARFPEYAHELTHYSAMWRHRYSRTRVCARVQRCVTYVRMLRLMRETRCFVFISQWRELSNDITNWANPFLPLVPTAADPRGIPAICITPLGTMIRIIVFY